MTNIIAIDLPSLPPQLIGKGIFTDTMISALVTSAILILLALVIRIFFIPRWSKNFRRKSAFRMMIEYLVGVFDGTAKESVHRHSNFVGMWYFAAAAFIMVGTLIELIGLRPVVSDLNCALALGLTTFILINVFGIIERKHRRIFRYVPNVINIITDAVVPFSMALRMFGSVLSGYLIMHLIYSLPWFALIGIPAIASVIFTLFHALIQSYIFMFLSMSFINEAIE